ncbi:MAG: glycosyltransferase [Nitrospirae bacterium]|nr:glycosyltransferase [Nitrospirota bacterium]
MPRPSWTRRLRIHHVVTSLDLGGAEKHVASLAQAQARSGHRVCVTYLKGSGALRASLDQHGIHSESLGVNGWLRYSPIAQLNGALRKGNPDIVHAHLFPAEVYASLASPGIKPWKLVATKHNDEDFLRKRRYSFLHRLLSSNQDAVICPSQYLRRFTTETGIRPTLPTFVIPYGIDPTEPSVHRESSSLRKAWGIPKDAVVFGFLGRFVPQKGLDVLIDALASVRKKCQCKLVLAGRGPLEASLKKKVSEAGLESRVVFAGFHSNPWPLYRAMDVFVLPSLWEGFGRVLLEAMLVGLPIVASRASSIPEIVEEGGTGRLVPSGDSASLATALLDLARHPHIREAMGRRGRALVKKRFSLDSMVEATEHVYRSVLH